MWKKLNEFITNIYRSNYKEKTHRILECEPFRAFVDNGEGIYYTNIKGSSNPDFIGKVIKIFSKGYTHSVAVVYAENLKQYITSILGEDAWNTICDSLRFFYDDSLVIERITVLVIASADDIGLVCKDYSNYQFRPQSVRKITDITSGQVKDMLQYLVQSTGKPYGITDLVFFPLKYISRKLYAQFDTEYDTCSENVYNMGIAGGIELSPQDNPSPGELEEANAYPIIRKVD